MTFTKKIIYACFVFLLFIFSLPSTASATSGACSGHDGVNCFAGPDVDGSVICMDNWKDSLVDYTEMAMCRGYSSLYGQKISCPQNASLNADRKICVCDEDFYPVSNMCMSGPLYCITNYGKNATYDEALNVCGCTSDYEFHGGTCVLHAEVCAEQIGLHSRYNSITQACICDEGYLLQGGTCVSVLDIKCPEHADFNKFGACECGSNYSFNADKSACELIPVLTVAPVEPIVTVVPIFTLTPVVPVVAVTPAPQVKGIKISAPDPALIARMKGRILLQTESHGEAWYVHPATGKRHYMKDGSAAYQMMRNFGLGIKNADLAKIPQGKDTFQLPASMKALKGKILLQVEVRGEAWYVHPDTGKRYYMKDGDVAYQLMRMYSLGISDSNLGKIPAGE